MKFLTINEMSSPSYMDRTKFNANKSDLTVACAIDYSTAGEKCTEKVAGEYYLRLPLNVPAIQSARNLYRVLSEKKARIVNLAGNGIHTLSQKNFTQAQVNLWVYDVFVLVNAHLPLTLLRSGGQTGVDIAAAVVGPMLNIPTEINFPKGFKQRPANGIDILQTQEEVMASIEVMQSQLKLDLEWSKLNVGS